MTDKEHVLDLTQKIFTFKDFKIKKSDLGGKIHWSFNGDEDKIGKAYHIYKDSTTIMGILVKSDKTGNIEPFEYQNNNYLHSKYSNKKLGIDIYVNKNHKTVVPDDSPGSAWDTVMKKAKLGPYSA